MSDAASDFPLIVRIGNQDSDPQYDKFIMAPLGMDHLKAMEIVDKTIQTIKLLDPETYEWEELVSALQSQGFEEPSWIYATERW